MARRCGAPGTGNGVLPSETPRTASRFDAGEAYLGRTRQRRLSDAAFAGEEVEADWVLEELA